MLLPLSCRQTAVAKRRPLPRILVGRSNRSRLCSPGGAFARNAGVVRGSSSRRGGARLRGSIMIDHIGVAVADMERAKAFYIGALRADRRQRPHGSLGRRDGRRGARRLWRQRQGVLLDRRGREAQRAGRMSRSLWGRAPRSTRSTARRSPPADATTALRGSGPNTTRTTTAPSSSIPTATMSKRCATSRGKAGLISSRPAAMALPPPPREAWSPPPLREQGGGSARAV